MLSPYQRMLEEVGGTEGFDRWLKESLEDVMKSLNEPLPRPQLFKQTFIGPMATAPVARLGPWRKKTP